MIFDIREPRPTIVTNEIKELLITSELYSVTSKILNWFIYQYIHPNCCSVVRAEYDNDGTNYRSV